MVNKSPVIFAISPESALKLPVILASFAVSPSVTTPRIAFVVDIAPPEPNDDIPATLPMNAILLLSASLTVIPASPPTVSTTICAEFPAPIVAPVLIVVFAPKLATCESP